MMPDNNTIHIQVNEQKIREFEKTKKNNYLNQSADWLNMSASKQPQNDNLINSSVTKLPEVEEKPK